MTRSDRLALLLSLATILAASLVTQRIFEGLPHIEDEMAFVWQARVIASGRLTIPSPHYRQSFLVPFVVDYHGQRFGKYPIGWPALLSLGEHFSARHWINPLLAGLAVWLTYRLGKRIFSEPVGLLAAGLTLTSPFFLMNSGSLLSHPFGLVLSAVFALGWLEAFGSRDVSRPWVPALAASLSLGMLVLTRPWTAVGVSLPFSLHGLYLLWRGTRPERVRLIAFGLVTAAVAAVYPLWQLAVTGDPWLNPYTLWWPYDTVGFGPGHGVMPGGHTLLLAIQNARYSLNMGSYDLFGWERYSWLFLPFGLWAARYRPKAWLVGSVFFSLVLVYIAYWIGAGLFGPRYYFEGLYSLTVLSAAGIAWIAGWPLASKQDSQHFQGWQHARPLFITGLLTLLVGIDLLFYTPIRLYGMYHLFGIGRSNLEPFLTPQAQAVAPALFIVHSAHWMEYSAFMELENPDLTTSFIFAWDIDPQTDAEVAASYPDRKVFHYYTDDPYTFYTGPRPEQ